MVIHGASNAYLNTKKLGGGGASGALTFSG